MTDDIAMPRQRLAFMDLETYSDVPIRHGAWAYAEGAEVLLWAYALNDGPVAVWDLTSGDPMPAALAAILVDDGITTVWHNGGMFDTTVLKVAMGIDIPLQRLHDTMVQALQHSLPGSLGALCEVLGVPSDKAKDKAGKDLIRLFCVPLPFRFPYARKDYAGKAEYDAAKLEASDGWAGRATSKTHPSDWARFKEYAAFDIISMREVYKRMPMWNCKLPYEREIFHVDQRINRRGMYIDLDLARGALAAVGEEQEILRERTYEMTGGQVQSASKRDQLLLHILENYGVDLPDMTKATLERRIADPDLPEGLKELLRVRLSTATTSTTKYQALLNCVSSDGRLRGTKQYCGASRTGRWAGKLFQPDNLPSRNLMHEDQIEMGIQALKDGTAGLLFDDVMWLTSSAIRGCIAAPPGKKLVVADLSNIEGRGLAWLAGEKWKMKAFAEFDAGRGHDLYALAYAKSFGVSPESVMEDKKAGGIQRQVGKVQELALGFQSGVGGFCTFAAAYGIDLEDLANKAQRHIPGEVWGQSSIMLEWHRIKGRDPAAQYGLSDRAWLVCESFVLGWRAGHPAIKDWWHDLEDKMRQAITNPGTTYHSGKVKVRRDGAWMRVVLPSGRALCYPGPALVAERKKKDETETADVETVRAIESDTGDGRTSVSYLGMNQYSRKWSRIHTYGGKGAENCLTGDTEVLTMVGWIRIDEVYDIPVWDGHEWVEHDGCVYKGNQLVLSNYGVRMTPDHLVLTEKGWRNASSCEGLNRADVGLPDGYEVCGIGERPPLNVGGVVRLREDQADGRVGVREAAEAGNSGVVRLHAESHHCGAPDRTRHDLTPGVLGVAQHVRPLPPGDAPGVSQLRRAGHCGVRALARIVRILLGGYGADLRDGQIDRAQGQRAGLQPGELPVAVDAAPGEQQAHLAADRHPDGANHGIAGGAPIRDLRRDAVLPPGPRVAGIEGAQPVYDLMNCGPRHQFVVRGADGHALIVHNCTQATARDVMAWNMPLIDGGYFDGEEFIDGLRALEMHGERDDRPEHLQGYGIVLTVHDECVAETPDDPRYNAEHLAALLCAPPPWALDMPLAAAGFESYRYKK